jgi:deoxyribonuclease V
MAMDPENGVFGDWDGSIAAAHAIQAELAQRVCPHDDFPQPKLLAGFDVGFEEEGTITRAAAVLLDADTLRPLETHIARIGTSMPYVPGLLSFRELPALVAALAMLTRTPDLVFVDGHRASPIRAGWESPRISAWPPAWRRWESPRKSWPGAMTIRGPRPASARP